MFERCVEISAAQGFRRIEAANLPMLGLMLMMELQFAEAVAAWPGVRANLAEQIGHRRAAMIAYDGLSFILSTKRVSPGLALEAGSAGLAIARSLGARRFIAYDLMLQAQREFEAGDPQASRQSDEANEIARETPSFACRSGWRWRR